MARSSKSTPAQDALTKGIPTKGIPTKGIPTKGEASRARIVDAAYALFLEQGYHGTSMRQIADRAGLTMGGIYNHFASKEAIWEAVFVAKHPYHEVLPALEAATGNTIPAYIQHAAANLVEALGRRGDLLNLMFIEIVEFNGRHIPMLYAELLPDLQQLRTIFAAKDGALRPLPLPLIARSFAGLFFSYYITELLLPAEVRPLMGPDSLDAFVDIYLHGIMDPYSEPTDG